MKKLEIEKARSYKEIKSMTFSITVKLQAMAIRVVKFLSGRYKIRKIFAYESTYQKEIIEFLVLD